MTPGNDLPKNPLDPRRDRGDAAAPDDASPSKRPPAHDPGENLITNPLDKPGAGDNLIPNPLDKPR